MKYGTLSTNEKELKIAILLLSKDELESIIEVCEEHIKLNPRKKKLKSLLKELNDIAVF